MKRKLIRFIARNMIFVRALLTMGYGIDAALDFGIRLAVGHSRFTTGLLLDGLRSLFIAIVLCPVWDNPDYH